MREERRLAPHQNDAGLAKNGQTVYAGSGSDMAEPTTIKEKPTEQVSNGEVRAVSKVAEIAVSKEEQTKEEASKAIKQFIKEEVDREEAPQGQAREQQVTAVQGVKDYFPNIPAGLGGTVADFYRELQGLTAKDAYIYYKYIPSEFFIRYYLRLRKAAEEKGQDTAFLAEIKKELAARKIDADSLYSQAKPALTLERQRRRHWRGEARAGRVGERDAALAISRADLPIGGGAGGLDLSGITDRTLRERGEVINDQIIDLGGQPGLLYNELRSRLSEVIALNGTVPPDQKRLLLRQVNEAIRMIRGGEEEEEELYRMKGVGLSGEHVLRPAEAKKIEADIDELVSQWMDTPKEKRRLPDGRQLKGNYIEEYYNSVFNLADAQPKTVFETAMGPGEREWSDFKSQLNIIMRKTADSYKTAANADDRLRLEIKREIIQRFINKYAEEHEMRKLLHNAFFIAETEGKFEDFTNYCKSFASQFADLAFLNKPEVTTALQLREYMLNEIKRENNGNIPPDLVSYSPGRAGSEWEARTKKVLIALNKKGTFGRTLDAWELDRALGLSRGLGMVFLRFPEIVAETSTFGPTKALQSKASIPWENISWHLNQLDHRIKRYETQFGLRGLLYAAAERMKGHKLWNQDEIHNAIKTDEFAVLANDPRLIDLRNIFRSGGPFTWVGWRPFVAALEENQEGFRKLLGRNPGITVKMFLNRYEYSAHTFEKYKTWLKFKGENTSDEEAFKKWWGKNGKGDKDGEKYEMEEMVEVREEMVGGVRKFYIQGKDKEKEYLDDGEDVGESLKKHIVKWRNADRKAWREAAGRIPHAVLRIILDEHNRLLEKGERVTLIKKISIAMGADPHKFDLEKDAFAYYKSEDFSQIERDVVTAKENLMKRRRQAFIDAVKEFKAEGKDNPSEDEIQEKAEKLFSEDEDHLKNEDFETIGEGEGVEATERNKRIENAKNFSNLVHDLLTKDDPKDRARLLSYNKVLVKDLLKKASGDGGKTNTEFSYAPTLEDLPFNEFNYGKTGSRGFFARKINDAFSVSEAGDLLLELIKQMPNFQNAEQIVEQLKKIYYKVESYNKEAAQDAIGKLAIGIIRFYQKDGILKVPIYGEMMQLLNSTRSGDNARGNSYAQTIYGGRAMAWDSDDIYNFTEMLKVMLVDKEGAKIIIKIRNETGGTALKGFMRKSKLAIYLLILFGFYEFASKLMTEKQ